MNFVDTRIIVIIVVAVDVVLTFVSFMSLCKSSHFNWICSTLKLHGLRHNLDGTVTLLRACKAIPVCCRNFEVGFVLFHSLNNIDLNVFNDADYKWIHACLAENESGHLEILTVPSE
jgi:hypothetical protein